jgi:nitrite reductase/ring-hydroxylating ferredoxin subunit
MDTRVTRRPPRQAPKARDGRFDRQWAVCQDGIPTARYIDKDFARLEAEKLWPHVWQMACRTDELRDVGDYVVYNITDQSIVVVRTGEATFKAYHNVCPHRATALAVGSGRFQLETIVCPFHGWKWNLQGENTFVADREEFMGGCLTDEYLRLHECQVGEAMGGVWINMDPDAGSLDEHLAPVRALIDPLLLDQMKFYWHKSIVINANWKVAQEAFHEAYHVPQTHPQLVNPRLGGGGLPRYEYEVAANGHGWFRSVGPSAAMGLNKDLASKLTQEEQVGAMVRGLSNLSEGQDSMVLAEDISIARSMGGRPLPPGASVLDEFNKVLREYYAAQGRAIPTREALADVQDMFVFPNITFLPTFGNLLMYRSRPSKNNDPDWCVFELYSLRSYGVNEAVPRWKTEECTDPNDPNQYLLIPRQDFGNIPRQQQGMHSRAMTSTILSSRQECKIRNMHLELDRYLES